MFSNGTTSRLTCCTSTAAAAVAPPISLFFHYFFVGKCSIRSLDDVEKDRVVPRNLDGMRAVATAVGQQNDQKQGDVRRGALQSTSALLTAFYYNTLNCSAGLRVGCWTPRPRAGKAVHTIYVLLLLLLPSHTRS